MRTVILFLFLSGHLFAQKIIQEQIDASQITTVSISGDGMFKINISTQKTNVADVTLNIEGENFEQVILQAYRKHDTLFLGSAYQPLFTPPDDKLSAHKKISIELTMVIPEHLAVDTSSDIASVFVNGIYENLIAQLLNGHFNATAFSGNLLVNTLHGNIDVNTNAAELNLKSKNGSIKQQTINNGINKITLHTVNGNISVTKTQ
ncbi:DUF4097 family beta strand repeat-containing protein [Hanstruepera marina]|uniref:hypothetical protein n=1 Tax=Hanstruepera marina TaxID=2873265 RepID=UPI001CA63BBF|nr:hypothetical protein [Hanstruepera marina]